MSFASFPIMFLHWFLACFDRRITFLVPLGMHGTLPAGCSTFLFVQRSFFLIQKIIFLKFRHIFLWLTRSEFYLKAISFWSRLVVMVHFFSCLHFSLVKSSFLARLYFLFSFLLGFFFHLGVVSVLTTTKSSSATSYSSLLSLWGSHQTKILNELDKNYDVLSCMSLKMTIWKIWRRAIWESKISRRRIITNFIRT